jgi:hypothetical protein
MARFIPQRPSIFLLLASCYQERRGRESTSEGTRTEKRQARNSNQPCFFACSLQAKACAAERRIGPAGPPRGKKTADFVGRAGISPLHVF